MGCERCNAELQVGLDKLFWKIALSVRLSKGHSAWVKLYCLKSGEFIKKDDEAYEVEEGLLERLFRSGKGEVEEILAGLDFMKKGEIEGEVLPPVPGDTEIWAAGVTYLRSKSARMEESEKAGGDIFYDLVYEAERPELFFKSMGYRAVGHGGEIRVRKDSTWDVPEPELTLAVNAGGEIFGFAVGNDVSSRSIEGENPLYLPQAKVYNGSCALGPCLLLGREALKENARVTLRITRGDEVMFDDSTDLTQLKRGLEELVEVLYRELDFPNGAMLMTGTGVVPGTDFSLVSGDVVAIEIEGIGTLENVVA
jgi:2-dehydro-3-deoxy-D-arabinonate dehydratase